MKYQIVALLDENYISGLEGIQKNICKKFRAYKCNPSLYISLVTTSNADVEVLNKIILKVLEPYKKFKVNILNNLHINLNNKQCSIGIAQMGYISRINRAIIEGLKQNNISIEGSVINDPAVDLCIPLTSCNYNLKKLSSQANIVFNKNMPADETLNFVKVNKLEIWKFNGAKFDSVAKSYTLREF